MGLDCRETLAYWPHTIRKSFPSSDDILEAQHLTPRQREGAGTPSALQPHPPSPPRADSGDGHNLSNDSHFPCHLKSTKCALWMPPTPCRPTASLGSGSSLQKRNPGDLLLVTSATHVEPLFKESETSEPSPLSQLLAEHAAC